MRYHGVEHTEVFCGGLLDIVVTMSVKVIILSLPSILVQARFLVFTRVHSKVKADLIFDILERTP